MLGKLMKYEIKATARWFLPLYGTMLIIAVINRFTLFSPYIEYRYMYAEPSVSLPGNSFFSVIRGIMSALMMFIYIMMFVGLFVATLIVTIQRYYRNLLGDEVYLMFTLPVKSWQHILSKLLISMLWHFLSSIAAICSILVLIPGEATAKIPDVFKRITELIGIHGIIILVLAIVSGLVFSILKIYTAVSLGHLFNKHRLLLSFVMYLGIEAVSQFIFMLLTIIAAETVFKPWKGISLFMLNADQFNCLFGIMAILTALLSAGLFILTGYLLNRKLNLE